ncbi:MAG: hypothetical protein HY664_03535 [Chloroflexi bacterium]|nr:hypothetical protein [Chloroflexota bacterium]
MLRLILLLVGVLSFIALNVGCYEGPNHVYFDNRTDRSLVVSFAWPSFSPKTDIVLKPRSIRTRSFVGLVVNDEILVVEAKDDQGNLVYSETLTLLQLKARTISPTSSMT